MTISYQPLGSNLGGGGELQDNAGAAIWMVGVAPKASVHAELNHEWRSKAFDEALRAARDWYLDSSTASKVCTLGDGACRHFVAFYVLTLNVSRAHRGPARARIELMGRRPTTGLSTLNNIFTSTLKGAKYVQLLRYVNVRHDMTSHFSCPFENGNGTDRSCDSCDSCEVMLQPGHMGVYLN